MGGYSAQRVLSGRGGGVRGKFWPVAKLPVAGSMAGLASGVVAGASDSATILAPASPSASPEMAVFRRFRHSALGIVARSIVARLPEMAVFCGFQPASRLIINYQLAALDRRWVGRYRGPSWAAWCRIGAALISPRSPLTDGGPDRRKWRKSVGGAPPFPRKVKFSPVAHAVADLWEKFSGRISACLHLEAMPESEQNSFGSTGVRGAGKALADREHAKGRADLHLQLTDSGPDGSGAGDVWGNNPSRTAQDRRFARGLGHVNAS